MIVYVARVERSDVTHLGSYVDEAETELRAICLLEVELQPFRLVRADEGERLVWCELCRSYKDYLAAAAVIAGAQRDTGPPTIYLGGRKIQGP